MKKTYTKPLISVEEMSLTQSISTMVNCTADRDDVLALMELKYFSSDRGCVRLLAANGGIDYDHDGVGDEFTTVCYHSNMLQAFTS